MTTATDLVVRHACRGRRRRAAFHPQGVGKGAEAGILIGGAEVLERAQQLDIVVFDKTGTLTKGEPSVTDAVPFDGASEDEILRLAAAVETGSEHMLSLLAERSPERGVLVSGVLEGGQADRAGLRPGDTVVAIYGKPVPDSAHRYTIGSRAELHATGGLIPIKARSWKKAYSCVNVSLRA